MVTAEEVCLAIEKNDVNPLISWLDDDSANSINTICSDGSTFLTTAVKKSSVDVVPFLLGKGADINQREKGGATPLLLAIHMNRLDMVQCLVTRKSDIDLGDSYDTPITTAVRRGHIEIAAFLIEKGANATVGDIKGMLPVLIAIKENNLAMVDLLLTKNINQAIVDADKNTTLIFAIRNQCNLKIIECLLKHGANANESKNEKTPLAWAAVNGSVDVLRLLLSSGADINLLSSDGNTALATAAEFKQPEAAKWLIQRGANFCKVGQTGKTPSLWAIHNEDTDMMKLLLDNGTEYMIGTIFLDAITARNLKIIRLLKERGASAQMRINNETPLKKSLETGSIEIVKYLLDNGANVVDDLEKKEISTIVQLLNNGKTEMVKLLTRHGARLCEFSECGQTPLTRAIQLENFDMVKYFLKYGANVDQANKQALLPLAIAEAKQAFQIFQYLVDYGAELNEQDQAKNPKLARSYQIAKEIRRRRNNPSPEFTSSGQTANEI